MRTSTGIRNLRKVLPNIIGMKHRKSLARIIYELIFIMLKYRYLPTHYFARHLYRREINNVLDYIPNKILYRLSTLPNDTIAAEVVKNKLYFDFYYGQFINELPKILMYNHGNVFVKNGSSFTLNDHNDFISILTDIVQNASMSKSVFIKKTYDSYGGKNTYKIDIEDLLQDNIYLKDIFNDILKSSFLFQESIIQHPDLDRLSPFSLNTIRMDVFIDNQGKCELMSAFIRMSMSELHVDNVSSGGCYVGIDMATGRLKAEGYSSITVSGGRIITTHPVTGTVFKGFQLPWFNEAKALALKASELVPTLRLIGWDIAISEAGPILIEGNCGYDITSNDLAYGGYRSHPVFRKILIEFN